MRINMHAVRIAAALAVCIAASSLAGGVLHAAEFQGTVDFKMRVDIIALTEGRVESVHANAGDTVAAGSVLVEFNSAVQEANERISLSAVERAAIAVEELKQEFERQEIMYDQGSLALTDYDLIQNNLNRARAELGRAKGELAIARHELGLTSVVAPMDAIVVSRLVEAGTDVRLLDSASHLMTLASPHDYVVRLEVPFDARASMTAGEIAKVAVQSQEYSGQITFRTLAPTGFDSYEVLVEFKEPGRLVLPGTPAIVTLP